MREYLGHLKSGDVLESRYLRTIRDTVQRDSKGSALRSFDATVKASQFNRRHVELLVELTSDLNDGIWEVSPIYYDQAQSAWSTDFDITYQMDTTEIEGTYVTGKRLTAFWHAGRGMLIPVCAGIATEEGGGGGEDQDAMLLEDQEQLVWEEGDDALWEDGA